MIWDTIENSGVYAGLGKRFEDGFNFIKNAAPDIAEGRYELDGENLFATVAEVETKLSSEGEFEAHKKYVDLQYIIEGNEQLEVAELKTLAPSKAYNSEKDCAFYTGTGSTINVSAGQFYLLFPQDGHKPCCHTQKGLKVKKLIVKIKL